MHMYHQLGIISIARLHLKVSFYVTKITHAFVTVIIMHFSIACKSLINNPTLM
jgi:hypothetical protein